MAEARGLAPGRASGSCSPPTPTPQAAIDAINRVGLDRYLMKPWDPPEEQLYPVLDDLLAGVARDATGGRRRAARGRPPLLARDPTSCATSWPATCVPYRWLDVERDAAEAAPLLQAAGLTATARRACRSCCWRTARRFARRTIARGRPARRHQPAGDARASTTSSSWAAARPGWRRRSTARPRACETALVERVATGGQAGQSSRIENYLGFPGRPQRGRSDRPRHAAGAQVRRRDAAGARGHGARGARRHARPAAGRRLGARRARRRRRHGRGLPPPGGARASRS